MPKAKYGKNKAGLYETSKTYDGKRVKFRGKTCAIVDQKIRAYEEGRRRGRLFTVVADEWLGYREKDISESTRVAYTRSVARLNKYFQGRYIRTITALDADRYIQDFEGRGYARNTVSTELSVLKQIMAYAVRKAGDIDVNPAREVTPSRGLPEKKRDALTEEQERLVEEYQGPDRLLGLLLLYTGCRRGELFALTWQDIDRKNKVIHITKKLNYVHGNNPLVEDHLKNADSRDIPLFDILEKELPRDRLGIIFPGADGGYMKLSELRALWKRYTEAVGLEGVTPHCFRHSYATLCYESGIDAKSAASFLGDTEKITQEIYTSLRATRHHDSAEAVNAYLELRRQQRTEEMA